MKESAGVARLLDPMLAPEAEVMLDELERSGQFRIGAEAELSDPDELTPPTEYFWGRGSGNVTIADWWTAGSVVLRVGPGIAPEEVVLAKRNDALIVRTADGLDRVVLDGYLGLIPDASTLSILFPDGTVLTGPVLLGRVTSRIVAHDAAAPAARSAQ
jgi:hypothetical protein